MLSSFVTCYLFLGGAGGGALAIICFLELFGRLLPNTPRDILAYRQLQARGSLVCFGLLALGALCLWLDLGRSGNVFALILSPRLTPLTIGAFSLALALLCSALLALSACFDSPLLLLAPQALRVGLRVVGLAAGLLVTGYTAALLGSSAAVIAWQSPLLLPLFVLSSLSSGLAALLFASAFADEDALGARRLRVLLNADTALIILELICLAAFIALMAAQPASAAGAKALLCGNLAPAFWGLLVAAGLMLPLLLERLPQHPTQARVLVLALCVLVGAAALRWCVVDLAAYDPSQVYAGVQYIETAVIGR